MNKIIHVCSFDSTEHLRGRARTYAAVKAAVLKAGRFSVFEATASMKNAVIFTTLERDPTVVVKRDYGYPWIGPVTAVSPPQPEPAP